jgi:hypothetical protein
MKRVALLIVVIVLLVYGLTRVPPPLRKELAEAAADVADSLGDIDSDDD